MALDSRSRWGFVLSIALYVAAAGAILFTGAKRHPLVVIAVAVLLLLAAALGNMTVRRVRTPPAQLPGILRLGVPFALMVIAIGLTAYFLAKGRTDGLGPLFLCGAFITAGHFLAELRSREALPIARGLIVLVPVGVVVLLAIQLGTSRPGWLLVAAVALLLAPFGLTLLATDLLRGGYVPPRLGAVAGIVSLVLGAFWLGRSGVDRHFVILISGVLLLLILAIAADTQADVVLVAVVLAFVWSGLPRAVDLDDDVLATPIQASSVDGSQSVLVALGDSYMSGEGAKQFYEGTNKPGEPLKNECRRAPTAYAHTVLTLPESEPFGSRLAFFACSGALGSHVWRVGQHSGEPPGGPGATQLQQLESLLATGAKVPLVLISIGGNDAGFSNIGIGCLAPGNCVVRGQLWLDKLQDVATRVDTTYTKLRALVGDDVPVLAVPYPEPLNPVRTGCGYSLLEGQEHKFLSGFVRQLNRVVRKAAADHGFYYLEGMERALEGLRICDSGSNQDNLGVNFIAISDTDGLADQLGNPQAWLHNSLHPNERGHAAMARVLADWMKNHPAPKGLADKPGSDTYDVDSLQTIMGPEFDGSYCGIPGFQTTRCGLSDTEWAQTEVSLFLRGILGPLLLICLGAWLLCLALLTKTRTSWSAQVHRLDNFVFGVLGRLPPI